MEDIILTGEVPSPVDPPQGYHFHPRCQAVFDPCGALELRVLEPRLGHKVVCHA